MVTPALIGLTAAIENVSTAIDCASGLRRRGSVPGAFVSMLNLSMLNAAGSRRGRSHAGRHRLMADDGCWNDLDQ
jgi:hypothetical protein